MNFFKICYCVISATILLVSCSITKKATIGNSININAKGIDFSDKPFEKYVNETVALSASLKDSSNKAVEISGMTIVDLQVGLSNLFDPEKFVCNVDEKLKSKLKKLKLSNSNGFGFIPKEISKNIDAVNAYLLNGAGGAVLANGFTFTAPSESESILLLARNSPTSKNFNEGDYIETDKAIYDNLFYTLDCSGYLSAALSVSGSLGDNSIKTSATGASSSTTSLVVISGVMYSPLYQAYKGNGRYLTNTKVIQKERLEVLEAILAEIPPSSQNDATIINLNSNYKVVLASNTGSSSFNGTAKLQGSGGGSFGFGSVSGSGEVGGNVNRQSKFSNYKTYTIARNINSIPDTITILTLKKLISSIKTKIAQL